MPELSRFYGMIIRMQYADNQKHHKPHVHVLFAEHEAVVGIDGEVLAGSLPDNKYKLLQAWLIMRENELYASWNKAVKNVPIEKIEPLK